MKTIKILVAVLATMLLLTSSMCSKDDEPKSLINLKYNYNVTDNTRDYKLFWGQNETLEMDVEIAPVNPTSGLSVKSFDVYLNDKMIASTNKSLKCHISHPLSGVSKGQAELKFVSVTNASGFQETKNTSEPIYLWITDTKPTSTATMNCPSSISNGSVFKAVCTGTCSMKEAKFWGVDLYWDGEKVKSVTGSNEISYEVKGQSAGVHAVQCVINWKIDGSSVYPSRVTEKHDVTVK